MDHTTLLQTILVSDFERCRLLSIVASLGLPDCWIGAGFVRDAAWDFLHDRPPTSPKGDIDVVWFDAARAGADLDRELEAALRRVEPDARWSVKNQARMHERNGDQPYSSATDAMRYWPETATAVAARMTASGNIRITSPLGLDDLMNLVVRPTPRFTGEKRQVFTGRVQAKQWLETWPRLRVAL